MNATQIRAKEQAESLLMFVNAFGFDEKHSRKPFAVVTRPYSNR